MRKLKESETKQFDRALKELNNALSIFMVETPTDYEILEPFIGAKKANLVTDAIIKLHKRSHWPQGPSTGYE